MVLRPSQHISGWLRSSSLSSQTPTFSQRPALRETAWLDGLRGVAAFLVVMNHYSLEWLTAYSDAPFGATVSKDNWADGVYYAEEGTRFWGIWRLPIFRVLKASGNAQVAIFFVLSGFVLSWRPIELVRSNRLEELSGSLGSSFVRRWFRLYLPCFVVMILFKLEEWIRRRPGLLAILRESWTVITKAEEWASPFRTDYTEQLSAGPPVNYPMWTIPFEFSGSMFVFAFVLALSRVQSYQRRMAVIIGVSIYAFLSGFWNYWLFGFGLALADYVRQAGGCANLSQHQTRLQFRLWMVMLAAGLTMMGWTAKSEWYTTPGYDWTSHVPLPGGYRGTIGEGRVWWGCGGIFVVASCCHLAWARRFLELRPIQHLGKISFMLYLTHLLINSIVSLPLKRFLYDALCAKVTSGPFKDVWETGPVLNVLIYFFLLVVSILLATGLAHVLEIYVDRPCTTAGRWVDEKFVNGFGMAGRKSATQEESILLQHREIEEQGDADIDFGDRQRLA